MRDPNVTLTFLSVAAVRVRVRKEVTNVAVTMSFMADRGWQPGSGPKIPMSKVFEDAGRFFSGDSPQHRAVREIARRLAALDAPFAVTGGFALNGHGYVRATDDVDLIVRPDDWRRFKAANLGLGYVERFAGSKSVRDAVNDVKIDVLFAGEYPGDGKPKPVRFPDPADSDAVIRREPYPVVTLPTLIQLKIACGKTSPGRQLRDYADVVELIRANGLDASFGGRLDEYVRSEYLDLLGRANAPRGDED